MPSTTRVEKSNAYGNQVGKGKSEGTVPLEVVQTMAKREAHALSTRGSPYTALSNCDLQVNGPIAARSSNFSGGIGNPDFW